MSFYNAMGRMGLGGRMKKISQTLMQDINDLYQDYGIELEAAHFPYLYIVYQKQNPTLREIQEAVDTSHAYISQSTKALKGKALIEVHENSADKRSKIVTITPAGKAMVEKAQPLWSAVDIALSDLLRPHEGAMFLALRNFESSLAQKDLYQRVKDQIRKKESTELYKHAKQAG